MVSEKEAAVFKKPTIRQINFPPGNAQDPQDYCKSIINLQNATNPLPYTISPSFHISQSDVIVCYKPIDSTIDAVRALTDNLTSQCAYLICFLITENNSIYCITKGLKAFKSVEKHEEKDFASRALHCIATEKVQMLRSRESFGMYTTQQLHFRKPTIPSMVYISGVVTKVRTKVDKSKHFDRNPIPNNVKSAPVEATHSVLTICKDLTLKEIVDLIECLDSYMDSDGYYIFEQVSEVTNKDMICKLKQEQSRLNREKERNVPCNGKIYCLVNDTKWLHFHKNFDAEIKAAFKTLIRNKFCDNSEAVTRLPKPWVDMERKADYISEYNNF